MKLVIQISLLFLSYFNVNGQEQIKALLIGKTQNGKQIKEYKKNAVILLSKERIGFSFPNESTALTYTILNQKVATINGIKTILYSCLDPVNNKHYYIARLLQSPFGVRTWMLYTNNENTSFLMFAELEKY